MVPFASTGLASGRGESGGLPPLDSPLTPAADDQDSPASGDGSAAGTGPRPRLGGGEALVKTSRSVLSVTYFNLRLGENKMLFVRLIGLVVPGMQRY